MKYLMPLKLYNEWLDIKPRRINGIVRALAAFHVDSNYVRVAVTNELGTRADDEAYWRRCKSNILHNIETLISEYNVMGIVVNSPCIKSTNIPNGTHSNIFIDDLCKTGKFEGLKYTYWPMSFRSKINPEWLKKMRLLKYSCSIPDVSPLENCKLYSNQRILERELKEEMDFAAGLMLQGFLNCGTMLNGDAIFYRSDLFG